MDTLNLKTFSKIVTLTEPYSVAVLRGNDANKQISGTVCLYPAAKGTLVVAEVFGLPSEVVENGVKHAVDPFFAFHIHEGERCGDGGMPDPFRESKTHYNPAGKPHPMHAGDLPSLLGNDGYAYMSTYTGRFSPEEVVGKTAVIHAHSEDFKTQPGGNPGQKLACGEIKRMKK